MEMLPEIKNRKSPLVFSEKDVEKDKIVLLVEAARWAPSCFNKQPWNYVFVQRDDGTRKELEKALSLGNGWAGRAPYIVVVGAGPEEACRVNDIPYYAYDCGLSVMSLSLEAEHLGLRVHQMAGYDEKKVRKALGFPENYRIVVVFALGYEGESRKIWDKLEQNVKDRLAKPRERKPAKDNFFFGKFKL